MFETNPEHETKGIDIDYGDYGVFRIKRAGGANDEFSKVLEVKTRPYRRQIDMGTFDSKVAEKFLVEAFVDTVLIGWENVKDKKGKNLEFSKENAVKLLSDLPELFADLREKAMNAANFLLGDIEDDLKN
jgi:hypothetical protein